MHTIAAKPRPHKRERRPYTNPSHPRGRWPKKSIASNFKRSRTGHDAHPASPARPSVDLENEHVVSRSSMGTRIVATHRDDLDQTAYCQAHSWAELVWNAFVTQGREPPNEWPGSLEQARFLVFVARIEEIDVRNRTRLAELVHTRARSLWQEFLCGQAPSSRRKGKAHDGDRLVNGTS